jgi:peptidoglycan/LPS O-acetylase OafA/YrhL
MAIRWRIVLDWASMTETAAPARAHLAYMPKLDGLRAVAVGLVLLQHFGPEAFASALGAGGIGVKIFFVLSGFLITTILLGYRESALGRAQATALFYWRRFLRLAPALYAALAAAWLLDIGGIRHDWVWAALYLYNFLVVARSDFGPAGHLWTLAVEEQFYVLWSLVVLFLPRRALIPSVAMLIAMGPLYRLALCLIGASNFPQVLLPGAIDGLALGALLSLTRAQPGGPVWRVATSPWTFLVGLAGVAALLLLFGPQDWPRRVLSGSFVNVAAFYAVAVGSQAQRRWATDWLAWAPLRHVGQISYGLYVYHYFLPQIAKAYVPALSTAPILPRALIYLGAAFVVAELSWRLIERPLRRWRHQVPVLGIAEPATA